MGAKAGFTLKLIQWFNRGVQFACCGLILALTAYFLAAMSNNNITIVSLTTIPCLHTRAHSSLCANFRPVCFWLSKL